MLCVNFQKLLNKGCLFVLIIEISCSKRFKYIRNNHLILSKVRDGIMFKSYLGKCGVSHALELINLYLMNFIQRTHRQT